jgi:NAD(P)-dependent dehydrogenase (short-subunit alcohol dehydrogenase family)
MGNPDLTGQVALVTGGGRGIGRAVATALAMAGASVAIVSRSMQDIEEARDAIAAAGGQAFAVSADVANKEAMAHAILETERHFGPIDLLINNAATVEPIGPLSDIDPDLWWRAMEVNLRGPMLGTRFVLPSMRARGRGRIVNISSSAGTMIWPNLSAYTVSKTALIRFTEQVAAETAAYGVCIFTVNPGAVRTDMTTALTQADAAYRERFAEREVPVERAVELILALASGIGDHLSGRFLSIRDDLDQLIARAEDIRRDGLYTLHLKTP